MAMVSWARLLGVSACGLRRGAWYKVLARSASDVQLQVHRGVAQVPRALLELRDRPPSEWTVVPAAGARDTYVVCPNCRARQPLPDKHLTIARCPRCNEAFAVAGPTVETPHRDLRMTRRRRGTDRRAGKRRVAIRRTTVVVVFMERREAERRAPSERRLDSRRGWPIDRRRRATVW